MKQKNLKTEVEEISTTVTHKEDVIVLKATKRDYIITVLLLLLIAVAIGFIIWTRNGYADNFTEQFKDVSTGVIFNL